MNQQRLQSYIELIQKLLACPSGEEWILLRQHEVLVQPELVPVMEQVANQLANQGNLQEAKFLHNLAGQIHHLFVAQTVPPAIAEDESQQGYLELIKALLACPEGAEGELLNEHQALIGPGLVHKMQQVAAQLATSGDREAAQYLQQWATELNRLWVQQHNFKPLRKKDPEPKYLDPPLVNPKPPSSEEDVWTELSGEVSTISSPPPTPAAEPVEPEPIEDLWAKPSIELPTSSLPIAPAEAVKPTPMVSDRSAVIASPPLSELATNEQINRHLETIATALTRISETLTLPPPPPPPNPLWYMEVLEQARAGNWVLTTAEIHQLIGVHPTCVKGSKSFQRGCWVFVQVGKLGAQTSWQVKKETELPE
jgi:hypothetical protein